MTPWLASGNGSIGSVCVVDIDYVWSLEHMVTEGIGPLMTLTSSVSKKKIDAGILLLREDQSKVEGKI